MALVKRESVKGKRRLPESTEHRVATPRADLIVVRLGKSKSGAVLRETEKTSALIEGIAKATRKPGVRRDVVFKGRRGRPIYAYSVYSSDVTKIVREDAQGQKTIGHVVSGKFKALPPKTA
ncbi:MAG TPA: hypothetical protein VMU92_11755 [Acidobacteriaceae bacterium]|nr:hypothetical protein [Acidobacteriaceae bacterium]